MTESEVDQEDTVFQPGSDEWLDDGEVQAVLEEHLDKVDYQIYRVLNENGRISDTELGEKVGLSRTAVRRRREKLQEEGVLDVLAVLILQGADLAYADIRVTFDPSADREEIREFIDGILYDELIYEIDEYMGGYDLLIRAWHASLQRLKSYISKLLQDHSVIDSYEMTPVIKTEKAWHKVLDNGPE